MIHTVLELITKELNQYLRIQYEFSENMAVLSSIVEPDGSAIPTADGKLIISLVSIEKDDSTAVPPITRRNSTGEKSIAAYSPVHLNLYIMFSANFSANNYNEGLKVLSHAIGFFQKNPIFTRNNIPDLDPEIEKLMFSIENLNIKDLSSLWSIISNKYLPSILYKTRLITIDSDAVKQRTPKVKEQFINLIAK